MKDENKTVSDYEKLKAFAEELNGGSIISQKILWYDDVCYLDTIYSKNGIGIRDRENNRVAIYDTGLYILGEKHLNGNLDRWIKDTRAYWKEKGLPSLQDDYISAEKAGEILSSKPHPKGKLYEMPNTMVVFDTEEEYEEYMQMCEDVGWTWSGGQKPVGTYKGRNKISVHDKFTSSCTRENQLTLTELKKLIGVEEVSKFNGRKCKLRGYEGILLETKYGGYTFASHEGEVEFWSIAKRHIDNLRTPELLGGRNRGWNLFLPLNYPGLELLDEDVEELLDIKNKTTDTIVYHSECEEPNIDWFKEHALPKVVWHSGGIIKQTKTNKIMNNIKNTAKRLLLSEPEKTFVKAGLMDIDKKWSCEAKDTARDQMLEDFMTTKKFKDQMTLVAEAIIEENK